MRHLSCVLACDRKRSEATRGRPKETPGRTRRVVPRWTATGSGRTVMRKAQHCQQDSRTAAAASWTGGRRRHRVWMNCDEGASVMRPEVADDGRQGVASLPGIKLMQADEVARPFHRDGRVHEEKYDGWRMVAYKNGTAVRLVSRAGKEHSRRFAELAAAIRALPPAALILDGQVAIFDDKLIARFEWFRKCRGCSLDTADLHGLRLPLRRGARSALAAAPKRRAELEAVLENDHTLIFPARRLSANGLEAWERVKERGLRGARRQG